MRMLLALILCLCASCNAPRVTLHPQAATTVEQATVQNDAIADTLRDIAPYQAAGIHNNGIVTRRLLELGANEQMADVVREWQASYRNRLDALVADWDDEKTAYAAQVSSNEKAFESAKAEAQQKGFWLKVLGGLAAAWAGLRALRGPLAAVSNMAGIPWLGTVVNVVTGVGNLPKRVDNLRTLVTGSDVGIAELENIQKQLDEVFDGKVSREVKSLTGEESLANLVRRYAKEVAKTKQQRVPAQQELHKVRDEESIPKLLEEVRGLLR